MTIKDFLTLSATKIRDARLQCQDPDRHASQIVEFILKCTRTDIVLRLDQELSESQLKMGSEFLRRRLLGEPFQYIAGEEWFWNSRFYVGPGVLIPRRETEIVVQALLDHKMSDDATIAELGAGSGNIGISMLLERPRLTWHGFEMNPASFPYLQRNLAELLPAPSQYVVHRGDFFEGIAQFSDLDVVVSNPPYVSETDMENLSKEVRCEPKQALAAGPEGVDVLQQLIPAASNVLKKGGFFVTEIDFRQSNEVKQMVHENGFSDICVVEDYSHRPRVITAVR